jgi:UDP-N-acetylmuramate--alanine ligase
VPAVADLPGQLAALARPGDLVLTLGAGDITAVAGPLLAALDAQDHQG